MTKRKIKRKTLKTGPQGGLYAKLLGDGINAPAPPRPKKPWKERTKLDNSRFKETKALWRRVHMRKKYKRFGGWVRGIRKRMKMSQVEFAKTCSVSMITVRRWEIGYGYMPKPKKIGRLKQLEKLCKDLKKANVEFED